AIRDRLPALGYHGLEGHMFLATADARDDAERAVVVAALDHADEVADPGATGVRKRLAFRIVVPRLEIGQERFVVADRHHRREVREARAQTPPLLPDQAPGQGDRALGRLPLAQLVELRVHPVLGRLADDAGIEDRHVGAVERLFDVARREQPASKAFGVRRVHLAPDRPDVESPGLTRRYLLSTNSRIPVRSSPSIEMSMNAGMQTRSRPPGAT